MIEVHRGAGMLVPVLGILAALVMNIITTRFLSDSYYQEHSWPKLSVLLLAGLSCLGIGLLLKKKRLRDASKDQAYIDSLSSRSPALKSIAFAGPRDHLMFIPLQYWSIVYFLAAIIYGIQSL